MDIPDSERDRDGSGPDLSLDGSLASREDGPTGASGGEETLRQSRALPDPPTTEDLVAAYDAAGEKEKRLVRSLIRGGHGKEAKRLTELLHYFPRSKLR